MCVACGSFAVQLLSVTEQDVGASLFADLIAVKAVGGTAGPKSLVLNTCMKCGAQWVPGTSETLDQIKKRKEFEAGPIINGIVTVLVIIISIFIFFFVYSCATAYSPSSASPRDQKIRDISQERPEGAAAVPSAVMQNFVRQAAKDYGISEEEARQALINGAERAYSKEEVERVFGR